MRGGGGGGGAGKKVRIDRGPGTRAWVLGARKEEREKKGDNQRKMKQETGTSERRGGFRSPTTSSRSSSSASLARSLARSLRSAARPRVLRVIGRAGRNYYYYYYKGR